MSVFAVIPVKVLPKSKTRLSEVLDPQERQTLTLKMLEDVLRAAVKSLAASQIVVVSSDSKVEEFIENFQVTYLPEKTRGLNQAVEQATGWCVQNGAISVLVLPADIPLISPSDVNQIINMGSNEMCIVIAPSRNGGTNALLRKPPDLIPLHFGSGSFSKHLAEASNKGVTAKVYCSHGVMMDIDSPEDLEDLLEIEAQTASHRFLKQIRLKTRLGRRPHG